MQAPPMPPEQTLRQRLLARKQQAWLAGLLGEQTVFAVLPAFSSRVCLQRAYDVAYAHIIQSVSLPLADSSALQRLFETYVGWVQQAGLAQRQDMWVYLFHGQPLAVRFPGGVTPLDAVLHQARSQEQLWLCADLSCGLCYLMDEHAHHLACWGLPPVA